MSKRSRSASTSSALVSNDLVKEIQTLRPLRLYIQKRRKKGDEGNPFALRSKFLQLSPEKQMKFIQKSVDKYLELLNEKDVSEESQSQGQLFDELLSKKEQKAFFEHLNLPRKPLSTAAAYYSQSQKDQHDENAKLWKNLSADEKQNYTKILNDARNEYKTELKTFSESLPARLRIDFRSFINENPTENSSTTSQIKERRKSVQFATGVVDEQHQQQKLTRQQLDELHKCRPSEIYYEKKVDDKPVFTNSTARNTYVRSIFKDLSEKKRRKFILKSMKRWNEYLQSNPSICDEQIPTLHLVLTRNEDILQYFSSLGLPTRPPTSALLLYNAERDQTGSQQYWADLSQTSKDDLIKRLHKMKIDYHTKLIDFVENILPSNYHRFEFFRNVKFANRDYEIATKDRSNEKIDDGQLKITQYLKKKNSIEPTKFDEFDRITRQLIETNLNNEQKKLVDQLSKLMHQLIDGKKTSDEVILLNGNLSDDQNEKSSKKKKHQIDEPVETTKKKKKKNA